MSKSAYEKPRLMRHRRGMMNKFGRAQASQPLEAIDGVPVAELVAEYGSPLFVFSEQTMVDRYHELRDAVARRYPKVRMAWSYKTNYLDAVCKLFHREGAWAEVVSAFEYEKARRLGVPGDRIHFNGPLKSRAILEEALPAGSLVHLDHFDELALVEEVAEAAEMHAPVAIRLNLAAEGIPAWSRFGFNLENGQARDAVRRILAGDRLKLVGLHCHLGTFLTEPEAYRQAMGKLVGFANGLAEEFDVRLDFIDIGGGIASHNQLKAQYLPPEQSTPAMSRYAEAITDGLRSLAYPPDEHPTLVMENGRALVDDAGYLVATVKANKRLPDGRRGVVVDAGVNQLFTAFWYDHDVRPAQAVGGMPEPTVFYGPLCMNIDVMRETLMYPPLEVDDRVIFCNVGAYNVTQWMQFITYRPAVVLIGEGGRHARIREAETLETVVAPERVPSWIE